jgi:hypothetical protein
MISINTSVLPLHPCQDQHISKHPRCFEIGHVHHHLLSRQADLQLPTSHSDMKSYDFIQHIYIVIPREKVLSAVYYRSSQSLFWSLQTVTHLSFLSFRFSLLVFSQRPESDINMKFFTSIVVSLSLGAQVLAAPIDVASTAVGIPAEAIAAIKAVPASSPFAKKSISITTITGAVSSLKGSASYELSSISKTLTPPEPRALLMK